MNFLRGLSENDWGLQIRTIAHGWLFDDVPKERFPKAVILPLENPDLHDEERFTSYLTDREAFRVITMGTFQGRRVGILRSKFGSPAVAMTVELLAAAGIRVILGIGYCGGLREDIACGDLVLPLAAVRNDGATTHYVPPIYPAVADLDCLDDIRRLLSLSGRDWHCGLIWSTDAVLMETTKLVQEWSGHGVIAVDMESSALLTIARLCNIKAATILVASDNPKACRVTDPALLRVGMDNAIRTGLEFVASLDFV